MPLLYGVKVLIVDKPDAREAVKLALIHSHAQVIAVATAGEGLEQPQTHRPDVIISDIGMPQMDGYEFIQLVRNLSAQLGGQNPRSCPDRI